jgi:hypothetical protein
MKYFQFQLADTDIRCSHQIDFQTSVADVIGKTYSKKRKFYTYAIFTALGVFFLLAGLSIYEGWKANQIKRACILNFLESASVFC